MESKKTRAPRGSRSRGLSKRGRGSYAEEESLTVYTDGFRAYDPLEDDENYQREAVIHGEGEYVDGDAHVNTYESHAWRDGGSRHTEASPKTS